LVYNYIQYIRAQAAQKSLGSGFRMPPFCKIFFDICYIFDCHKLKLEKGFFSFLGKKIEVGVKNI
jgi:hypothetical protein